LLTIARNAATDDQKSAYQRLVKQDTEDGILPNVPSAQTNQSHPSDVVLISERLAACLEKLDMERKQVIERFAAGESQDDIAHQLLIPLGTVKSRLSRGRQDLKICLGDLAP
jgi:RNA polymerase sigma-70 factor (ECF subfamily)